VGAVAEVVGSSPGLPRGRRSSSIRGAARSPGWVGAAGLREFRASARGAHEL